jgi:hypothetical protein
MDNLLETILSENSTSNVNSFKSFNYLKRMKNSNDKVRFFFDHYKLMHEEFKHFKDVFKDDEYFKKLFGLTSFFSNIKLEQILSSEQKTEILNLQDKLKLEQTELIALFEEYTKSFPDSKITKPLYESMKNAFMKTMRNTGSYLDFNITYNEECFMTLPGVEDLKREISLLEERISLKSKSEEGIKKKLEEIINENAKLKSDNEFKQRQLQDLTKKKTETTLSVKERESLEIEKSGAFVKEIFEKEDIINSLTYDLRVAQRKIDVLTDNLSKNFMNITVSKIQSDFLKLKDANVFLKNQLKNMNINKENFSRDFYSDSIKNVRKILIEALKDNQDAEKIITYFDLTIEKAQLYKIECERKVLTNLDLQGLENLAIVFNKYISVFPNLHLTLDDSLKRDLLYFTGNFLKMTKGTDLFPIAFKSRMSFEFFLQIQSKINEIRNDFNKLPNSPLKTDFILNLQLTDEINRQMNLELDNFNNRMKEDFELLSSQLVGECALNEVTNYLENFFQIKEKKSLHKKLEHLHLETYKANNAVLDNYLKTAKVNKKLLKSIMYCDYIAHNKDFFIDYHSKGQVNVPLKIMSTMNLTQDVINIMDRKTRILNDIVHIDDIFTLDKADFNVLTAKVSQALFLRPTDKRVLSLLLNCVATLTSDTENSFIPTHLTERFVNVIHKIFEAFLKPTSFLTGEVLNLNEAMDKSILDLTNKLMPIFSEFLTVGSVFVEKLRAVTYRILTEGITQEAKEFAAEIEAKNRLIKPLLSALLERNKQKLILLEKKNHGLKRKDFEIYRIQSLEKLKKGNLKNEEISKLVRVLNEEIESQNDFSNMLFSFDIEIVQNLNKLLCTGSSNYDRKLYKDIFNIKKSLVEFTNIILKTDIYETVEAEVIVVPTSNLIVESGWSESEKQQISELLEFTKYNDKIETIINDRANIKNFKIILGGLEEKIKMQTYTIKILENENRKYNLYNKDLLEKVTSMEESITLLNKEINYLKTEQNSYENLLKVQKEYNNYKKSIFSDHDISRINNAIAELDESFFSNDYLNVENFPNEIFLKLKNAVKFNKIDERILKLNASKIYEFYQHSKQIRLQLITMARLIFVIHYLIFEETGIISWMRFGNNLSRKIFGIDFTMRTTYRRFKVVRGKDEYITNRRIRTFSFWSSFLPINGLKMFNAGVKSKLFVICDNFDKEIIDELLNMEASKLHRIGNILRSEDEDSEQKILVIREEDIFFRTN